jgi:hypothetical protein
LAGEFAPQASAQHGQQEKDDDCGVKYAAYHPSGLNSGKIANNPQEQAYVQQA